MLAVGSITAILRYLLRCRRYLLLICAISWSAVRRLLGLTRVTTANNSITPVNARPLITWLLRERFAFFVRFTTIGTLLEDIVACYIGTMAKKQHEFELRHYILTYHFYKHTFCRRSCLRRY